jgi:hypothetical protein
MLVDMRAANKSTKDLLCNTGGTLSEKIIILAPILGYIYYHHYLLVIG